MKKLLISALLLTSASVFYAQTNLITDGSFELLKVGTKSYITVSSGKATGMSGKWQLTFAKGGCPEGCCEGTSEIVNTDKKSGENSIKIAINKQTNRNDVKLLQSIKAVPAGVYEITFWAKSDAADCPLALDVLMATQPSSNNGKDPFTGNFVSSTDWKQYKLKVDISAWTDEERNEMRISIRPNTTKTLPIGPFPKTFWIDDVTFTLSK
ncbi:MAG: carbohydrate binding domain-containing protein [Paludibacter sp.]